jgi:hypothetical protein
MVRHMWNSSISFVPRYQLKGAGKWRISKSVSLFARKVPTERFWFARARSLVYAAGILLRNEM